MALFGCVATFDIVIKNNSHEKQLQEKEITAIPLCIIILYIDLANRERDTSRKFLFIAMIFSPLLVNMAKLTALQKIL